MGTEEQKVIEERVWKIRRQMEEAARQEGRKPEESVEAPEVPQAVIDAYGKDKIDDLIRQQETQNYYILSPEQLDSDEAIEMVERTPAFKRDKRKASMAHASAEAPAQQPAPQTQRRQDFNHISFSADDK